ncbi:MAG TPA: UDP-N-acetyl-D-mannosamine dehydrogenase, partial [Micrococcus luteus]|nr:UDP-N-acetyl-D-mannosamine dehydrogenase [Micrococcus luteus]
SPALNIAAELAGQFSGSDVLVVEPHVTELPAALQGKDNVRLVAVDEALEAADIVVLLVDHSAFADLGDRVADKRVIDTRGQWRTDPSL